MIIDLGEVIDAEGVFMNYTSPESGSYNLDGEWVGVAGAAEQIIGVIQPAKGRQLLDMPEGVRAEARFFLWTRKSVALRGIVNYGGANYKVVFVWPRPDGGFTRAAVGLMNS